MRMAARSSRLAVYVSAAGSGDIHVLRPHIAHQAPGQVNQPEAVGHWQTVQRLALGGAIMPMAVSPRRDRLYAVNRSAPFTVHTLAVDANTGHLSLLGTSPLAGNMVYVSTSLDGRYLMTSSYGEDLIAVNAIEANGLVGPTLQVLGTPRQAHAICPAPDGQHVWVSCLGADQLLCYQLDSAPEHTARQHAASPLSPEPVLHHPCRAGSGPRHLAFHPNGRWLFVINELDGSVDGLALGEGSKPPTPLSHARILPPDMSDEPWSAELRISPDGQWLFATDRRAATLSALRIDTATGQLTLVDCLQTDALPRSFALSPDGLTLFVASQETGRLSIIDFNPTQGRMHLQSQLDCGTSPTWVEAIELPQ